jgi:hypothetical protein
MIQAYIRLKLLIGIRRGDMLRLRMSDLTDARIMVRQHKTINTEAPLESLSGRRRSN